MEINRSFKPRREKHIHSPSHALADELANKLSDKKHFGFYLKLALTHDHGMLRRIAGEVLESKTTTTPGALFAYLIRKSHVEHSQGSKSDPQ